MSSPNFPPVPFPLPLVQTVHSVFKQWETYIQTKAGSYQNAIAFKLAVLSWTETVAVYGYLGAAAPGDVLTGSAHLVDDDYTFNPDQSWGGGGFLPSSFSKKHPVSATLATINGHEAISLVFDAGNYLTANLSAVVGKDLSLSSALVLSGERANNPGGRILGTFDKVSFALPPGTPLP